jgi:hypothetical protein
MRPRTGLDALEEGPLPQPRIEPQFLCRQAHSIATIPNDLSPPYIKIFVVFYDDHDHDHSFRKLSSESLSC